MPTDQDPQATEIDEFEAAFAEFSGDAAEDTASNDLDPPEAGLSEEPTDEQPAADEDGEIAEAQEAPTETGNEPGTESGNPEGENDPWASAPDDLRQEHEKLQRNHKAEIGRQRAQQMRAKGLEEEVRKLQAENENLRSVKASEAGGDEDESNVLKDEFPEFDQEVNRRLDERLQPFEEERKQREKERYAAQIEANREVLADALEDPEWEKLVHHEGYADWLAQQPDVIQRIVAENADEIRNPHDAAYMLNAFRQTITPPSPSPKPKTHERDPLLAAVTEPSVRKTMPRASGAPDDFDAAFDYYANKT